MLLVIKMIDLQELNYKDKIIIDKEIKYSKEEYEQMDINGLDTRHQLKGTFVTRSQYPGTYSAENEDDFIWTTNWNVYSLQLGNIRSYYDIKFHNSVNIIQKTIVYIIKSLIYISNF